MLAKRLNPSKGVTSLIATLTIASTSLVTNSILLNSEIVLAFDSTDACELLNGTYRDLGNGDWLCLYDTPRADSSLGAYCRVDQGCDRFYYRQNSDGSQVLILVPGSNEQLDD
ncbi:MAG: hypothetical protein HC769_09245 [Cyanobacteria bacterium CRU_2_1]|nr:hypothetical protein [Cyanobacteria bacterium RU_5_0]NJR59014.1 hypothetical protein [Cyanobacteria bacterium CRU_2_1]